MRKLTIIPELMNSEEISILDENNIPVIICQKSMYRYNNNFQPPSILVDNFEKERYKEIEIKNIDLDYLAKLNYRLVSISLKGLSGAKRNYPRQTQCYMLEAFTKPIPHSVIITKIPKEHFVEFDITNSRIRIRGRNGYPYNRSENATPWITVIKK